MRLRVMGSLAEAEYSSKVVQFGEDSLTRAVIEFVSHCHFERNHQGKYNLLLCSRSTKSPHSENVKCKQRLGGFAQMLGEGRINISTIRALLSSLS
jgi:hypothetical protein